MKVEISGREKNDLFSREEVSFEVTDAKVTPSKKELREKISALTNANPEAVIIGRVVTVFGSTAVSGTAKIYKDAAAMKKAEPRFLLERNFGKQSADASAKPGEKAEEAKAEPAAKPKAEKKAETKK